MKKQLKDFTINFFYWWYNQNGTNTEQGFDKYWQILKDKVFDCLADSPSGYFLRKAKISEETKIPVEILTHILKEMKIEGAVFISTTFSEWDGMASGSGYGLSQKNKNHSNCRIK